MTVSLLLTLVLLGTGVMVSGQQGINQDSYRGSSLSKASLLATEILGLQVVRLMVSYVIQYLLINLKLGSH